MSDDLVKILRDYQAWMKDGESGGPSIGIDDIDGDQTFGAAADYIEALEAVVEAARALANEPDDLALDGPLREALAALDRLSPQVAHAPDVESSQPVEFGPNDDGRFNLKTSGAISEMLLADAVQAWSWCQLPRTTFLSEAARTFNQPELLIARVIEGHPWMTVGPDGSIEHEGE